MRSPLSLRNRRLAVWAASLLAVPGVLIASEGSSAASVTLTPVADAMVTPGSPTQNFGKAKALRTDGSPIYRSYVRFNVPYNAGPVDRAVLRVWVSESSPDGFSVAPVTTNSWGETTLTWDNAPAPGTAAHASGAVAAGTWHDVDITSLVAGKAVVSLALIPAGTSGGRFHSRENTSPPQLLVESGTTTSTTSPSTTTTTAPAGGGRVVVAAGDIACATGTAGYNGGDGTATACRQKATSQLALDIAPDVVATLGDHQYPDGSLAQFNASYHPSWGRLKAITRPAVGNHEYNSAGADGYFSYFGTVAGARNKGYYSYDLGGWHVVVLNTNCNEVGGCGAGSPQETWLRADLAAHPAECTLAYWHHPRWSSGKHGNDARLDAFMRALYNAGVEVLLTGHEHHYERFAPQTPAGMVDAARGVREFIVGSGGKDHYPLHTVVPNSERRNTDTFGVLRLNLRAGAYDWSFVGVPGTAFTDSGTGSCH